MSPQPSIEELTNRAQFVFEGTIVELGAATLKSAPVTELTAVVRLDEVLSGPEILSDFRGAEITVQLAEDPPAEVGQRAVFFARSWLQGESLAVVEIGRRAIGDKDEPTRGEVRSLLEQPADELQARVDGAALIVSGRISAIGPAPEGVRAGGRSEHEPDFREGLIEVATVEKGELAGSTVPVVCAQSRDVVWARAPKLEVGLAGIWLLHLESIGQPPVEVLAALDPLDFQPLEQLDRVRSLASKSASG